MKKEIQVGSICWLHFHNQGKSGHSEGGDYSYCCCYAPNHSKKIEDEELYVKVAIKEILFIFGEVRFVYEYVNKDGSVKYSTSVDGAERLTAFDWKHPESIEWSCR